MDQADDSQTRDKIQDLLATGPRVVNVGLEMFAANLDARRARREVGRKHLEADIDHPRPRREQVLDLVSGLAVVRLVHAVTLYHRSDLPRRTPGLAREGRHR